MDNSPWYGVAAACKPARMWSVTELRIRTIRSKPAPASSCPIGACATPGRVFKGTRMSGRMGNDTVTTQNLTVHAVDADKGLILLKGAVPGPKGGLVVLRSAAKSSAVSAGKEA
jgi:ribosomal protein L3